MTDTLLIRHLPDNLTVVDKEELLKYFGAVKVSVPDPRCHTAFATFSSNELAAQALRRLHQMEIGSRRLIVEFAVSKSKPEGDFNTNDPHVSSSEVRLRKFIKLLNSWNDSVEFRQPPPPHIKYKYPSATPEILINIVNAVAKHVPLYTQVLHLMNKMCLDLPFAEVSEDASQYFINNIIPYFSNKLPFYSSVHEPPRESTEESELSSEENISSGTQIPLSLPNRKRKVVKKPRIGLLAHSKPKIRKKPNIQKEDVFEVVNIAEAKKISVKVSQDLLTIERSIPATSTVGIGKIYPVGQSSDNIASDIDIATSDSTLLGNSNINSVISKNELLENKISLSNMKILPVFKNYHPGAPSQRLYIKNLAKTVSEADIHWIFKRYVNMNDEQQQLAYDMRLMQEGRMKGQAFVTLPSIEIAEKALNETNGFLLKDKPLVVQFARSNISSK